MKPTTLRRRGALLLLTLALGTIPVAWADDRADVEAATARWIDAFNRKSTPDIVALYAADAVFFGTTSPVLRDAPALVQDYFKDLPALGSARISLGEHRVQMLGTVAISTGFYSRVSMQDGREVRNPARFTFVYQKRGAQWLIINHHSSALPEPAR
jgi:hypothetical protein